jgi:hypothetical protein
MNLDEIETILCEVEEKHNTIFHRKTAHYVATKLYYIHKVSHETNSLTGNFHSQLISTPALYFRTPATYFKAFLEGTIPIRIGDIYIWAYVQADPYADIIQPIIYKSKDQHENLLTYHTFEQGTVKSCVYISNILSALIHISGIIENDIDGVEYTEVTHMTKQHGCDDNTELVYKTSMRSSVNCCIDRIVQYLINKFAGTYSDHYRNCYDNSEHKLSLYEIAKGDIIYDMIINDKFKFDSLIDLVKSTENYDDIDFEDSGCYRGSYVYRIDLDIINSDQIKEQKPLCFKS